ncbi:MAG TPA: hypothetical protein VFF98_14835 [Novosphingobium sp.]|nr:hypothetical protein [Novosphingobium sp.]HZV09483.1 hypothetical protein [Novosphingobium sp.]
MDKDFSDLVVLVAGIVITGLATMTAEHMGVAGAHEVGVMIIGGLLALARNRAPASAA